MGTCRKLHDRRKLYYELMKARFKFNGGRGALLCSRCFRIIKTGEYFNEQEKLAMRGEINLPPHNFDKFKNN